MRLCGQEARSSRPVGAGQREGRELGGDAAPACRWAHGGWRQSVVTRAGPQARELPPTGQQGPPSGRPRFVLLVAAPVPVAPGSDTGDAAAAAELRHREARRRGLPSLCAPGACGFGVCRTSARWPSRLAAPTGAVFRV